MSVDKIFDHYYELVLQLNAWTKAYDEGKPEISDATWDRYYFKLVEYEKEHPDQILPYSPTQTIRYQVVNELKKVKHEYQPMLSLAKTKSIDTISDFTNKHLWVAMLKLDGLSCRITYEDGKLVRAETRGNGEIGEDITHNIMTVKNVPKRIEIKEEYIIDGEIICDDETFSWFKDKYQNSRNFAAGSIRLLDARECAKRGLSFIAWDVIAGYSYKENLTLSNKLVEAKKLGFETTTFCYGDDVENCIDFLRKNAKELGYPIDGIVFKWDICQEYNNAGRTEHHFNGGLAYKFYDESHKSKLKLIEWSMGRKGILTPVAIIEPITFDGSTISRCNLHNVSCMEDILGQPYIDQEVDIVKYNQIIPGIEDAVKIEDIEKNDNDIIIKLGIPTKCPFCNADTELIDNDGVKTLHCTNKNCDGLMVNKIDHYFGNKGLDVKGISKATIEKLIDWGWVNSITDMYKLHSHQMEWTMQSGFGKTSVFKILDAIDDSYKNVQLDKFISALGIPLIGQTAAKQLANHFKTWDNFMVAIEDDTYKWTLKGFGYEMIKSMYHFDYEEAKYIAKNFLIFEEPKEETTSSTLEGKTFVITGKLALGSRDKAKEMIEAAGGKVASAVSSKTNYLVNNDSTSESTKNKKAKELGVQIITEQELLEMIGH